MKQGRLLSVLTVVFVVAMGFAYFSALQQPNQVTSPSVSETAESTSSAKATRPKAPPRQGPPPKNRKPRFSTSSKSSSNLEFDKEADTWTPNTHQIEGRVLAERSRPVPGARITYRTDGKKRTTKSDESGRFSITARGKLVTLQAERKDGLLTVRSETVSVEGEGGEWEVDLVLKSTRHGGLGVGVEKHRDGLRVRSVVSGGPAAGLGLRKGDIILEAGGTTMAGFGTREASDLLIGPEGSAQTILVRHKDNEVVEYSFRRQHIEKY